MKNLGKLIALSMVVLMTACTQTATEKAPEENGVETERTTTTTTTIKTNTDGTTINVDKDGFEVGNTSGSSETQVKMSKDSVRIKLR
jgi:ABC-type enterochelin transport system substrate-binding protein